MNTAALLGNGFLPTRASWMLDFVALAMLFVLASLTYCIYTGRPKKNPRLHRTIQIATAVILVFALVAFEIDVRFITKWRELAKVSPFYDSGVVDWSLTIHLIFAIPTPIIWGVVIVMALRRFTSNFAQGDFNRFHRISGRVAALFMVMTALTGWAFYYLAFVAS